MRIQTDYTLHTGKLTKPITFSVVSDLHNEEYDDLWPMIRNTDALLVPGDIVDRYHQQGNRGIDFLREAAKKLPTFFSLGNHDLQLEDYRKTLALLQSTGAEILINRYVPFGEMWIGGWYDPQVVQVPDMMDEFEGLEGCKVLLCHKPNHYIKYLRNRKVDLVVSGHAHGGQIRIGNQGLYAPGQLFFPRYTRGLVDGRMIISAGAGNPVGLPRWNNPCEVLHITLT